MPERLGIFAGEMLTRGKAYFRAFPVVSERDERDLRFPTYFLLAHSVELVLKSDLVAKGTPKKALGKKPLGHDVRAIYSRMRTERSGCGSSVDATTRKSAN